MKIYGLKCLYSLEDSLTKIRKILLCYISPYAVQPTHGLFSFHYCKFNINPINTSVLVMKLLKIMEIKDPNMTHNICLKKNFSPWIFIFIFYYSVKRASTTLVSDVHSRVG